MPKSGPVNHIVVLVDGTDASFRAADLAIELARIHGARLTALSVVETETLRQLLNVKILVDNEMAEFERELETSSRVHLAEVHERALRRKLVIEEELLMGNAEVILPKFVQDHEVDLIAIGGFEYRQATKDLLARQRQLIVDRSLVPVLVVK